MSKFVEALRGPLTSNQSQFAENLMADYGNRLRAFLRAKYRNPDFVDDVIQDTILRMMNILKPDEIDNPKAYLFRTAMNVATDMQRYESRRPIKESQPLDLFTYALQDTAPGPDEAMQLQQLQDVVQGAMALLPERCQQVFLLRRFEDMDTDEIAARFGISRRMVQKYLAQAAEHFNKILCAFEKGHE